MKLYVDRFKMYVPEPHTIVVSVDGKLLHYVFCKYKTYV